MYYALLCAYAFIHTVEFYVKKTREKKNREIFFSRNRKFFWPIPTTHERRLRIQSFIMIGPPISEKSVPNTRTHKRSLLLGSAWFERNERAGQSETISTFRYFSED